VEVVAMAKWVFAGSEGAAGKKGFGGGTEQRWVVVVVINNN
jgi:hypothetical protein